MLIRGMRQPASGQMPLAQFFTQGCLTLLNRRGGLRPKFEGSVRVLV